MMCFSSNDFDDTKKGDDDDEDASNDTQYQLRCTTTTTKMEREKTMICAKLKTIFFSFSWHCSAHNSHEDQLKMGLWIALDSMSRKQLCKGKGTRKK